MPPELLQWLPRSVIYGFGLVILTCIVLSRICETKENVANALGRPGRAIYRRAKARAKRSSARDADYKLLQWRIDKQDKLIRRNEAESEARHHKLRDEIKKLELVEEFLRKKLEMVEEVNAVQQDMTAEYLREDAQWHIDASLLAAEQGLVLPPHRSFTKFCSEYRAKHGMEYGRRWSDEPKR